MLFSLLSRVLTKMEPPANAAPQTIPISTQKKTYSDDELRALKQKIPVANMMILKKMTTEQIIENLRLYSPDFYSTCSDETLARIPAIIKE